jgi:protein TonB
MVERHIKECPLCSDAVEGLAMVNESKRESAIQDIHQRISQQAGGMRTGGPGFLRRTNAFRYVAAVAALVILVGSVYWYQKSIGDNTQFIAATEQEDNQEENIEKQMRQEKEIENEKTVVSDMSDQQENKAKEQKAPAPSEPEIRKQSGRFKNKEAQDNVNQSLAATRQTDAKDAMSSEKETIADAIITKDESEQESGEEDVSLNSKKVQSPSQPEEITSIGYAQKTKRVKKSEIRDSETVTNKKSKTHSPPQPEEVEISAAENDVSDSATVNVDTDVVSGPSFALSTDDYSVFKQEETVEEKVFVIVEEMPEFKEKNGMEAFRQYIVEHIEYPKEVQDKKIEGKVYVQFIVNKNGNVEDVEVIRGVHPLLDKEAVRVIKSSPAWKPGKQRGEPVNVQFVFPIEFSLE